MTSVRRTTGRRAPHPRRAPRPRRAARAARREPRTRRRRRRAPRRLRRVRRGRLPGRPVRAEVTKSKRDYANARAVEVLEPSPDRVPVRCDHEGGECPGSPWQALRYERQLEHKQRAGRATRSRRSAGSRASSWSRSSPPTDPWRYRNKMEYSFGRRDGGRALVLGFHARGRWDRIDDARDCMLASERSNAVRNLVRDWCAAEGLSAYRPAHGRGLPAQPRRARGPPHRRPPGAAGDQRRATSRPTSSPRRSASGSRRRELAVDPDRRRRGGTTQGGVTDGPRRGRALRRGARAACASRSPRRPSSRPTPRWPSASTRLAGDYAGLAGTRAGLRPLLRHRDAQPRARAARRRGLGRRRSSEEAIADAIANARAATRSTTPTSSPGDVRDALRPLAERAPRPDVVVVDPPRAGLSKKVVAAAARAARRGASSTSRATRRRWRRTPRQMVDDGYRLVKVRPVDMFPHTPHIECVALLERDERRCLSARLRHRGGPRPRRRARELGRAAARATATRRCGRTTIRGRAASRRPRSSREAAPGLDVGVAVLALDRHTPDEIAAKIAEVGLDPAPAVGRDRRRLHQAPARSRAGRPRGAACSAAGRHADRRGGDGTEDVRARGRRGGRRVPQLDDSREGAAWARERVHEGAREAGRDSPPVIFGYVRVAVGPDAARAAAQGGVLLPRSCTRATSATSSRSAPRRARSASPPSDAGGGRASARRYERRSTTSSCARSPTPTPSRSGRRSPRQRRAAPAVRP